MTPYWYAPSEMTSCFFLTADLMGSADAILVEERQVVQSNVSLTLAYIMPYPAKKRGASRGTKQPPKNINLHLHAPNKMGI